LKPEFPEARFNLGNALALLERFDEAIAEFRAVVAARPGFVDGWCNLGQALAQDKRFTEAVAAFREALRLAPDNADARAGLERVGAAQESR
jgi:cytochrome c-type biogenesis protein CcmH/NrfG